MELFLTILRTLMLTVAALMAIVYVLLQAWQPVPGRGFALKGRDLFFYFVVAFLAGFGTNNEWGLLAFAPLLLARYLSATFVQKNKIRGSGRWMEVEWRKFTPKGYNIPQEMMRELGRIPADIHFLFPRFASMWAVKFAVRSLRKNASKVPQTYNASRQNEAFEMIERTARNIAKLDTGRTEQLSLPFGVLKITRL